VASLGVPGDGICPIVAALILYSSSLRRADGDASDLSLADTGIGIPPEGLPHIFDEFRQVERQSGEKSEGTGRVKRRA
jgi:DNA topoisomerase VI subunit B